MLFRAAKYYVVISAVAALLAVVLGAYLNVGQTGQGIYCDQNVAPNHANDVGRSGPCRLKFVEISSVFGRIFVILTVSLQLPAYVYFVMRRRRSINTLYTMIAEYGRALELRLIGAAHDAAGDEGIGSRGFGQKRITGLATRIIGSYLAVSSLLVFFLLSFLVWAKLDLNQGGTYCAYSVPEKAKDFFVGGEACQIQYFTIFWEYGVSFIVLSLLLQCPVYGYLLIRKAVLGRRARNRAVGGKHRAGGLRR